MINILSKFIQLVKQHKNNIILTGIVFLLILLAFSIGYITAKYQPSQPLKFIDNQRK